MCDLVAVITVSYCHDRHRVTCLSEAQHSLFQYISITLLVCSTPASHRVHSLGFSYALLRFLVSCLITSHPILIRSMLSRGAVDCVPVYMLRPDPAQVEDSRASQPLPGPAVVRSALMLAIAGAGPSFRLHLCPRL